MLFGLSTRWNASRHRSGEAMIEEIRSLGFERIELGYDLTADLVLGVRRMVDQKVIAVDSVHNFCPVPVGAPYGHPEIWTLANADRRIRESAVIHTARTIEFAAEMGARVVVTHSGYVDVRRRTEELIGMFEAGEAFSPAYEKVKLKLMMEREERAPRFVEFLCAGIEALLPTLQKHNVRLGLEIVPSWEGVPTEAEMDRIAKRFASPLVTYWHDTGHGQVRQNLGFVSHLRWVEKLQPHLSGLHLHDAASPAGDHLMPPDGAIPFERFRFLADQPLLFVLEPSPAVPPEVLRRGRDHLAALWSSPPAPETPRPGAGPRGEP